MEDLVTSGLSAPDGLALDLGDPDAGGGGSPPPTVRLSASPASIERGRSATLTWSSTNAVSATLTPGIGSVPVSGSRNVSPVSTTTYRITVRDAGGRSASATATVTVTEPPADLVVILAFGQRLRADPRTNLPTAGHGPQSGDRAGRSDDAALLPFDGRHDHGRRYACGNGHGERPVSIGSSARVRSSDGPGE